VFIDWSQNSDFKSTVCVYAMRAKSGEPLISMPISWKELSRAMKAEDQQSLSFAPVAAIKRIKRIGDLFEPVLTIQQKLPTVFAEALAAGPPRRSPHGHTTEVRCATRASENMRPSVITQGYRNQRRCRPTKQRTKDLIVLSFRNTRQVTCITIGTWKCKACCARGRSQKAHPQNFAKLDSRCMSKITLWNMLISRARFPLETMARAR
jgi:hypothetical protein